MEEYEIDPAIIDEAYVLDRLRQPGTNREKLEFLVRVRYALRTESPDFADHRHPDDNTRAHVNAAIELYRELPEGGHVRAGPWQRDRRSAELMCQRLHERRFVAKVTDVSVLKLVGGTERIHWIGTARVVVELAEQLVENALLPVGTQKQMYELITELFVNRKGEGFDARNLRSTRSKEFSSRQQPAIAVIQNIIREIEELQQK